MQIGNISFRYSWPSAVTSFAIWSLVSIFPGLTACGEAPLDSGTTGPGRPNILVILADDAGFIDFGFQGSTDLKTPNIDSLARNGVVFTDAHVSATVCSPSRAGLLTGRYQQRFGHEANLPPAGQGMDPDERTLADALKQLGYRTALFGKWHLGVGDAYHPNNRGFDHFSGFLGGSRSYFPNPRDDAPGQPRAVMRNRTHASFEGYYTDVLADQTVDFIEANRDSPFFAFLSFNAVHTPMEAREDDLARFVGHPRETLAAMTWAMDRAVGKVLNSLSENGLTEKTLIFFLSDNGGAITNDSDNGALKGWKGNKFEGGQRVPMIIQWKGQVEGGRTFDGLVSALDILPTAIGATGETVVFEKALDGVNLLPYLQGTSVGNPHEILFWRKEDEAAVRQDKWKLIRLDDFGYVLYDLEMDLGETEDVKERFPEKFEELKGSLKHWESQMIVPLWHEAEPWLKVTWEIHEALMQNRQPARVHP